MDSKATKEGKRTLNVYEERFEKLMMLIRIDRMLKKAEIKHKK